MVRPPREQNIRFFQFKWFHPTIFYRPTPQSLNCKYRHIGCMTRLFLIVRIKSKANFRIRQTEDFVRWVNLILQLDYQFHLFAQLFQSPPTLLYFFSLFLWGLLPLKHLLYHKFSVLLYLTTLLYRLIASFYRNLLLVLK